MRYFYFEKLANAGGELPPLQPNKFRLSQPQVPKQMWATTKPTPLKKESDDQIRNLPDIQM